MFLESREKQNKEPIGKYLALPNPNHMPGDIFRVSPSLSSSPFRATAAAVTGQGVPASIY